MARYKVPQDVEAEDKLLGPFTFRQFIYLLIAAAGIAGAWGLFQLFPLLALIPLPFIIFFGVLALPLKKDQPMETYLAAVISFYLKPNRRIWLPGQRESTVLITAPKQVEKSRTRNITEDEATHRLSFLANIVDTEGYAIRENGGSSMREEYAAEADAMQDVLDAKNPVIDRIIAQEQTNRKQELVREMRTAVERTEELTNTPAQPEQPQQNPNTYPIPEQYQEQYQQPQYPEQYQQPQYDQQYQQPQYQQDPYQYQEYPEQYQQQQYQEQYQQPQYDQQYPEQYQEQPQYDQQYQQQPQYQQPGYAAPQPSVQQLTQASLTQAAVNQQLTNLANNDTFSIQTIANQANRIQQQAMTQAQPAPQPAPQPVTDPTLRSERQFEEDFMQAVRTPSMVQTQNTFNSMMPPSVSGLTPPEFKPMSTPLPHETGPGQLYRPIQQDEPENKNDRPDLYGPPTAIFS